MTGGEGGKRLGTATTDEGGVVLVDSIAAARAVQCNPATIRGWASKGWIDRRGTDGKRRALYSLVQVYEVAELARRKQAAAAARAGEVVTNGG
ncbi:MerR-like transcriptional regulator [Arthrobacter phage Marchesin]|nr:MerR-like transcriptional regulator [Arthrobacter phage Marchesin]